MVRLIFLVFLAWFFSCKKLDNTYDSQSLACGVDATTNQRLIQTLDPNLQPINGEDLTGTIVVDGRLESTVSFTPYGCFEAPTQGLVILRTVDFKYTRSVDAETLAHMDRVYLLDDHTTQLLPAEPLRDHRLYFGQEFYFVEPGYILNFYSDEHLKNMEIEYCLDEIKDPDGFDFAQDGACKAPKYYFYDNLPKLDRGLWSVKFRKQTPRGDQPWTRYRLAVKVFCEGVHRDVEEIWQARCTDIDNLEINGPGDLSRLLFLSRVTGYLKIQESDTATLQGLRNITSAGDVWIDGTKRLRSLDLPPMKIKGDLYIGQNAMLEDVDGLRFLTEVQRNFAFSENDKLVSLEGLKNLRRVGGDFSFFANLGLQHLEGLRSLEFVGGRLGFLMNDHLRSLEGLRSLRATGGLLLASEAIESLEGLRSLRSIARTLEISRLHIDSLHGLRNLEVIGGEGIKMELSPFKSFVEMSRLRSLTGLRLSSTGVESLAGLEAMKGRIETFVLSQNEALRSVAAVRDVTAIAGSLSISENKALVTFDGLAQLKRVEGDVFVTSNENLSGAPGLGQLEFIGMDLFINGNPALKDLNFLGGLKQASQRIEIEPPSLCQATDFSAIPDSPISTFCQAVHRD